MPGVTPFVRDERDRVSFLAAIERTLEHCARQDMTFMTLSEYAEEYGTLERSTS